MREKLDIIRTILENSRTKVYQDKLKTTSNISPQMFKQYVGQLIATGRIEQTKGEKRKINYQITKKGENTLQILRKIRQQKSNILRSLENKQNKEE